MDMANLPRKNLTWNYLSPTDEDASLFIGNFASQLARSESFAYDLLSFSIPPHSSGSSTQSNVDVRGDSLAGVEAKMIKDWETRLISVETKSLNAWRTSTLAKSITAFDEAVHLTPPVPQGALPAFTLCITLCADTAVGAFFFRCRES